MYTCGIIGHREFKLNANLNKVIENLIVEYNVDVFNFGTKSNFALECAKVVQSLQKKYSFVKMRIFLVRGEFRFIKGQEFLLSTINRYEKTVLYDEIYEKTFDEGKLSYIKRDKAIIDNSDLILCYYTHEKTINKKSLQTKSGTSIAIEYAKKS